MELEDLEKRLEELEVKTDEQRKQIKESVLPKVITFSKKIINEYGNVIKSISVFGSAAKGKMKPTSDIDVWVIIDDTFLRTSKDLEDISFRIRLMGEELKLHVQISKITEFWSMISKGTPEFVNFLRNSLIIFDSGFLRPTQKMLSLGLILPSEEAIEVKKRSSVIRFEKIKEDLKSIIFDLRYCVTDIIQAVVMKRYNFAPDPKTIPQYLEKMINEKIIPKNFLDSFIEIDSLWKKIEHGEIKEVDGDSLERVLKITSEFINSFIKLC